MNNFFLITHNYRLVPDLLDEDYTSSSKSDSSDPEDELNTKLGGGNNNNLTKNRDEDDEIGDGLRMAAPTCGPIGLAQASIIPTHSVHLERTSSLPFIPGQVERRRRKLPEIPKNKKCKPAR